MPNADDRALGISLNRLGRDGGPALMVALALPIAGGALLVAQAYVLANILHDVIMEGVTPVSTWPALVTLGALLIGRALLATGSEIAAVRSSEAIKLKLRRTLGARLIAERPERVASRSSGALSGAMVEQVEALDGYLVRYMPAMVQAAILPLAFAAAVLPVDWIVAALFLVTAPLIPVFMALAGWGAEAASRAQAESLSRLSGRFADRLRGLVTLKAFGRAEAETEAIGLSSEDLRRRSMKVMRIAFLSSAVLEFFAALGVAGVALYIGLTFLDLLPFHPQLTLAGGLFCLLMAPEVYQPLRLLAAHYHDRASAKSALAEIEAQFGAETAVNSRPVEGGEAASQAVGPAALTVTGLSVATPDGRWVIDDCDLEVAPGERIAIMGASGIGKSTLIEAIGRLRDYAGAIRLDGADARGMDEARFRARVALVGQRPRIFAGSIAENIRLGRLDACPTSIGLAARTARIDDFAAPLPEGLDTEIGEDGLGVSGGEAHRIGLARLYLRDPGLILLDEPTAHLDRATEAAVLDGIMAFADGRTLIVATHSAAVAARMDRVYRLVGGRMLPAPRPALKRKGAA